MKIDESDQTRNDITALRVIDLAEMLRNLQFVPGFDECIAKMRTGDIEGTHAELDLGRMLYLNKVPFRYVVPQGITGMDYDVEVECPNGVIACAEAKCTIESTTFGENAIRKKLERARTQLPPERPGIIFVKMPPKWMDESGFLTMIVDTTKAFLRGTGRVVSVKFYVSPNSIEGGYLKQQHAYKEISNPNKPASARPGIGISFTSLTSRLNAMGCLRIGSGCCFSLMARCSDQLRFPDPIQFTIDDEARCQRLRRACCVPGQARDVDRWRPRAGGRYGPRPAAAAAAGPTAARRRNPTTRFNICWPQPNKSRRRR